MDSHIDSKWKRTGLTVLLLLCGLSLICSNALAQAQPQGKPAPAPTSVTVVNGENNPVPVRVVSEESNGILMTLIDNAIPSTDPYYVDVRPYRYFTLLGDGNGGWGFRLAFVDSLDGINVGRIYAGICLNYDVGLTCYPLTGPGPSVSTYAVAGPFLEVVASQMTGRTTLRIYLQK